MASHGRFRIPETPDNEIEIARTIEDFRQALTQLTIPQLMDLAARQAAAQQAFASSTLRATLTSQLPTLDSLTPSRSDPGSRASSDRGRAAEASRTRTASPLPGPLELLSRTERLGRAVAGKLAIAHVRAEARRQGER